MLQKLRGHIVNLDQSNNFSWYYIVCVTWAVLYVALELYEISLLEDINALHISNITIITIAVFGLISSKQTQSERVRMFWHSFSLFFSFWFMFFEYVWKIDNTEYIVEVFEVFFQGLLDQLFVIPIVISLYIQTGKQI